ncbi:MAG: hypothetical protein KKI18_04430 [Planctomycetes bacterium]|nr:hypothetical protein [Planctomycetota bacterium]
MLKKDKKIIRLIILIIVAVFMWFLYNWGGNLLRPIAIRQIKQLTGARVDIDSVVFRFNGRISFKNIRIGPLLKTTPDNAILTAKKLDAYFAPTSFLKFKPQLKSLRIEDFSLNIQYNGDEKQWNVAVLKPPRKGKGEFLPELKFKHGEIKFTQVNKGIEAETIACNIKGGNARTTSEDGNYLFTITEAGLKEKAGNRVSIKWTKKETQEIELEGYLPRLDMTLFGSKCNINGFYSKITSDKEKIAFKQGLIAIGPQTVIDVNGTVRNFADPEFVFGVRMKNLNVRRDPADNCFAHGSRIFESFIPLLQVFFDNFDPQGLLDLNVVLTGKATQIAKTQCRGYLNCKDVSMRYFDFPYLVEHMAGRIDVTETSMTMKDLKASHGKVDITMNGYCDGFGETMDSNVVLSSNNMLLDEDLYAALLENHKKLWYIFSPSGMVSGDFIYAAKPPNTRIFRLYADLLDVSIMCQYFPYPVTGITGKIGVDGGLIELKDVISQRDGGTIKMQGRITEADTPNPEYDFKIQANDIAIDNKLIGAFPQEQKKFFSNFEIQAEGDADINIHSIDNNEMPIDYLAKLNIRGDLIKHPMLSQPLKNVILDANLTPLTLEVKNFSADFNQSPINATGTIWTGSAAEPLGYCMKLTASKLSLDSNTIKPFLGEGSVKMLEDFQFAGNVNLDAVIGKNARIKCPEYQITVDCLGNAVFLNKLNMPLKNITGKIIISPENIELRELSATPAGRIQFDSPSRITLNGKIKMAQQQVDSAQLKLTGTDINFDPGFTAVLGKAENYYTKLAPAGKFDLNFDDVKLYKNDKGDKILDLKGTALFKNCSVGRAKPISNIYAMLNVDTRYRIGKGMEYSKLLLDVQSLSFKDRPIENLKLSIPYDSNDPKIIIKGFVGDCLGGKISGDAIFETDSNGTFSNYQIDIALIDVGTEKFVSPRSAIEKDTGGAINGELHVLGDFKKPQQARGRLLFQATGIKPRQTGIVSQIRTAIFESAKKDLAFDNIKVQAFVKGNLLQITRFDLYGPTASMRGTGTYEPATDSINISFTAYSAAGKEEPGFFESLTAGFGPAFLKVEMTGKLENPQIKVEPLPIFKKSLEIIGTR